MAEIVVGPVTEVVKCIAPFMKRQFKYLCCFDANVESLTIEASDLECERQRLQSRVVSAERDGPVIYDDVKACLEGIREIQQKKGELDTKIERTRGGGCISIKSRYAASREAVKIAAAMNQMRMDAAFITKIIHPPPPASSEFESRDKFEQHLMTLLKDEKVKIVGICGMSGVGKTTLAQKIRNRVLEENVFGECVISVVSHTVTKERIQGAIAYQKTHLLSRAQTQRTRLASDERILIVLDDVREHLELKELEILGSEGCTVLLTSRDRRVLEGMKIDGYEHIVLEMKRLNEKEAWSLFMEKLGTFTGPLSKTAQDIVNECKCLPLALTTVAGALKNEENIVVWRSALQQLKSSNPEDLPVVLQNVYNPIKLSYDSLRGKNVKFIFLLCALFPEDFDIPLKDLTAYAMGLHMFGDIGDLEQDRYTIKSLVKMLKSHCLLLEGRDEGHVRMHDIVRDVAIFIASKENPLINPEENLLINPKKNGLIKCGYDSTWISPFVGGEKIEFSKSSIFPKLRLLLIDESAVEKLQVSDDSFEGMKWLNVLSINDDSFTSLTHTKQVLKNLHTLILRKCRSLKTLCGVGELTNLEVLYCQDCGLIEELPVEIGRLTQLKLLHISECESLKTIGAGVISRLLDLEELTLLLGRSECPQMERFSSGSLTAPISFENLKSIEITSWWMLELGLWNQDENRKDIGQSSRNQGGITFPKLARLELHDLPRLTSLCKGIEFPLLTRMDIMKCPKQNTLVTLTGNDQMFCKAEDVAIFITDREGSIKSFSREETNDSIDVLDADNVTLSIFPNLRFLLINNGPYSERVTEEFPFGDNFFESTRKLKVLSIRHCILRSLPHSIQLSKGLRTLVLESSVFLEDISVVSELVSLETLYCQDCVSIKELPVEIRRLTKLKLLHISDCASLQTIEKGVISSLSKLEELTLIRSFNKWNISNLEELSSLSSLTRLTIEIEDASLVAKQIHLSLNSVEKIDIRIGNPTKLHHTSARYEREVQLVLEREVSPGDWFRQLVRSTESLVLQGQGSGKLVSLIVTEFHCLKRLIIQNTKLARLSEGRSTVFPVLECLCLEDIDDFEEIHNGRSSSDSFKNLQEIVLVSLPRLHHLWNVGTPSYNITSIHIAKCDSLRSLFPLDKAGNYLLRLQRIIIRSCSMLEQMVLQNEEENGQSNRHMGKLQFLDLHDLPRFTFMYKDVDSIVFTFNSQQSARD